MTIDELAKLTKIRDDAKGSFWDFDKWRVMARLDQLISDAQHEHETNAAAYDALKANAPEGFVATEEQVRPSSDASPSPPSPLRNEVETLRKALREIAYGEPDYSVYAWKHYVQIAKAALSTPLLSGEG